MELRKDCRLAEALQVAAFIRGCGFESFILESQQTKLKVDKEIFALAEASQKP